MICIQHQAPTHPNQSDPSSLNNISRCAWWFEPSCQTAASYVCSHSYWAIVLDLLAKGIQHCIVKYSLSSWIMMCGRFSLKLCYTMHGPRTAGKIIFIPGFLSFFFLSPHYTNYIYRMATIPVLQQQENYVRGVSFDTMTDQDQPDYSFTLRGKTQGYQRTRRSRTFLVATDLANYSDYALDWAIEVGMTRVHIPTCRLTCFW